MRKITLFGLAGALLLIGAKNSPLRPGTTDLSGISGGASSTSVKWAGSVKGAFSVTENGNASYSIPIAIPPGTNHMQPEMTLVYSSGGENGAFGMGWSLQGLSMIERVGATPVQDGYRGGIDMSGVDRLLLDGDRLMNTNGIYWQGGTIFHTEKESWKKVSLQCSGSTCYNNPKATFQMKDGKGRTYDYESYKGFQLRWYLTKVSDLDGNFMRITYTGDIGQVYPDSIVYTYNSEADLAGNRIVKFDYRPRTDKILEYEGFTALKTDSICTGIRTFIHDSQNPGKLTQVKEYTFGYKQSTITGRSLLINVKECDGAGNCLPETDFSYTHGGKAILGPDVLSMHPPLDGPGNDGKDVWPGDFNGDGWSDIVYRNSSRTTLYGYTAAIKTGTAGRTHQGINKNLGDISYLPISDGTTQWLSDVNGDGLMDYVYCAAKQSGDGKYWVQVMLSEGNQFKSDTTWGEYTHKMANGETNAWMADMNGDGMSDFIYQEENSQDYYVLYSKGDGFATETLWAKTENGASAQWFGDLDGDGKNDLLYRNDRSLYAIRSNAAGTLNESPWGTRKNKPQYEAVSAEWLEDLNGDGLLDYTYMNPNSSNPGGKPEIWSMLSIGDTFTPDLEVGAGPDEVQNSGSTQWLTDLNGDGFPDYLCYKDDLTLWACMNNGRGTFLTATKCGTLMQGPSDASGFSQWPVDLNGDGLSDFQYLYRGVVCSAMWNDLQFPDLMEEITNGLNGTTQISYTPMTDSLIYQKSSATTPGTSVDAQGLFVNAANYPYPNETQDSDMYLVSNTTQSDERDSRYTDGYNYSYAYTYSGAIIDLSGHGWLGFESMSTLDMQSGRKRTNYYQPVFPYDGLVRESVTTVEHAHAQDLLAKQGDTLQHQLVEYQDRIAFYALYCTGCVDSARVYLPLKTSVRTDFFSYGKADYSIGMQYGYDTYGNPNSMTYLGYVNSKMEDQEPMDNVYTARNWYNDEGKWLIGYLETVAVSSKQVSADLSCDRLPSSLSMQDFSFQIFSYNSQMHVSSICRLDNAKGGWLRSSFGYDGLGNLVKKIDPVGNTTKIAYDSWFKTFQDCITSPPNKAGKSLVRYHAYDPRFGTLAGRTDYNDKVFLNYVDPFGRLDSIQGPNPDPQNIPSSINQIATSPLTGSRTDHFASAEVLTLSIHTLQEDDEQYIWTEESHLIKWPEKGVRRELGWQKNYLDGLGRNYQSVSRGEGDLNIFTFTSFNSHNLPLSHSYPFQREGDEVCEYQPSEATYRQVEYDIYDRPVKITEPSGLDADQSTVTLHQYPASDLIQTTFASGAKESYQVHQYQQIYGGKLKTRDQYILSGDSLHTSFVHDQMGRQTKVTDPSTASNPKGISRATTWDYMNRTVEYQDPEGGWYQFDYGDNGKIHRLIDPNNQESDFAYDGLLRMVNRTFPDRSMESYTYDNSGENGLGRLDSVLVLDPDGSPLHSSVHKYEYDDYGNPISYLLLVAPNGGIPMRFHTQGVFDPLKRLISITNPDDSQLTTDYGVYCNSLSFEGAAVVNYSVYDAFGNPGKTNYSNRVLEKKEYSPAGLPTNMQVFGLQGTTLMDNDFEFDPLNRAKAIQDMMPMAQGGTNPNDDYSESYTIEAPGRLTNASCSVYGTQAWKYDASGNLTAYQDTSYTYKFHQLQLGTTSTNPKAIKAQYDKRGNMTSLYGDSKSQNFTYDSRNRLITASGNGNYQFAYDHHGKRICKSDPDGTMVFYVSPFYEAVVSGLDITHTRYFSGPFGRVGASTPGPDGSDSPEVYATGTVFAHRDHLGNTVLTTDEQAKASRTVYAPYGQARLRTGANNFRYSFGGKEMDGTGLYYFAARYYHPGLGRFISSDDQPGGKANQADIYNVYAYVLNDPVSYADPSGHHWLSKITREVKHTSKVAWRKTKHGVTSKVGEMVISSIINTGEIIGGGALDIVGMEALGDGLISMGANGLNYEITHRNDFSWGGYGAAQLNGAIQGVVGGAVGMVDDGAVAGVVGNFAGKTTARLATNAIEGKPLYSGMGRTLLAAGTTSLGQVGLGGVFKEDAELGISKFGERGAKLGWNYFSSGLSQVTGDLWK